MSAMKDGYYRSNECPAEFWYNTLSYAQQESFPFGSTSLMQLEREHAKNVTKIATFYTYFEAPWLFHDFYDFNQKNENYGKLQVVVTNFLLVWALPELFDSHSRTDSVCVCVCATFNLSLARALVKLLIWSRGHYQLFSSSNKDRKPIQYCQCDQNLIKTKPLLRKGDLDWVIIASTSFENSFSRWRITFFPGSSISLTDSNNSRTLQFFTHAHMF